MKSLWSDADAAAFVGRYAAKGVNEDLALRTYSSRLLGGDPRLVMHGGGNTSVKTTMPDIFGRPVRVLCIKGSGRDLAVIEPDGHPAVRLDPLFELRTLASLSDEAMVNAQRQNLLDTGAPNPSVETLLHAYVPHKFVDHTHSIISTAIASLPDSEAVCREIFGDRVAFVPYVMPGFDLGKVAADVFEAHPESQGLLLAKHGIFSYAATARESYELMVEFITLAEDYIARNARPQPPAAALPAPASPARLLPILRGALAKAADAGSPRRWVLSPRADDTILRFVNGRGLADYAGRGVATPEQVIRIKMRPAILPPAPDSDLADWAIAAEQAIAAYVANYQAYFDNNNARVGNIKRQLDPLPRVLLVPGLGVIGVGKSFAEAEISCDVAGAWMEAVLHAESIGTFESISEAEHFDMEYWSLEQAKLGKGKEAPLARHVVVVTGGAGAIGAAIGRGFAAQGADVVLLDRDLAGAEEAARGIKGLGLACDVTDPASVATAFEQVAARYGGLDILVSNAGAAWTGAIATLPDDTLRQSFELNFFAHQRVAQVAVAILRQQGLGGALLFNVSKQAVNAGESFGAYGTAKAALLALVRQYALEHGRDGIRANAVNPDRIRSGLLTDEMIRSRADSRGVSVADYMAGNLLNREVTADDVAAAFVASALMPSTTGNVVTVDGGNVAAMLR